MLNGQGSLNPTTNFIGVRRSLVGTEGSNLEHRRCSEEKFDDFVSTHFGQKNEDFQVRLQKILQSLQVNNDYLKSLE